MKKFNKVYSSNENLKVSFLPFNRPRSQNHIKSIAKSIEKHGWFGTVIMIWTRLYGGRKEQLYVIDGQHRMDAANMAGVPYRYEIVEVTNKEEVISLMADLNNNSKGWALHDYLAPWISLGLSSYSELLKIWQDTKLPLAGLIRLYSSSTFGGENGGAITDDFKRGAFVIKTANRAFADKVIKEVQLLKKVVNVSDAFLMAFAGFYQVNQNKYRNDRMIDILKRNKKQFMLADRSVHIREMMFNYWKAA